MLLCYGSAGIGSFFTDPSIPTWYASIQKPWFNPPNWIFGPVWTLLFTMMGVSLYLIWVNGFNKKTIPALSVFGIQLILNTLWSILFFGLMSPFYAFVEIIFLWLAIALTIKEFLKISRNAGLLLVPYIVWVSFASVLNFYVWILN